MVGQYARRFKVGDEDLGAQTVRGDEGGGGVRFVLGLGEQVLRVRVVRGGGGRGFGVVGWVGGVVVGWGGDGHGVEKAEGMEVCDVVWWVDFRL